VRANGKTFSDHSTSTLYFVHCLMLPNCLPTGLINCGSTPHLLPPKAYGEISMGGVLMVALGRRALVAFHTAL
jgi:hypothetical protein